MYMHVWVATHLGKVGQMRIALRTGLVLAAGLMLSGLLALH